MEGEGGDGTDLQEDKTAARFNGFTRVGVRLAKKSNQQVKAQRGAGINDVGACT